MTYHQLTQEERYLITAQLRCGESRTHIARLLGRHPSTISRELRRNVTTHDGEYRAEKAHSYAVARRRRCRRRPHFSVEDLALVARLLRKRWSAVNRNPNFPSYGNRKVPTRLRFGLFGSHEAGLQLLFEPIRIATDIQRHGVMQ